MSKGKMGHTLYSEENIFIFKMCNTLLTIKLDKMIQDVLNFYIHLSHSNSTLKYKVIAMVRRHSQGETTSVVEQL